MKKKNDAYLATIAEALAILPDDHVVSLIEFRSGEGVLLSGKLTQASMDLTVESVGPARDAITGEIGAFGRAWWRMVRSDERLKLVLKGVDYAGR
jgi:hypothetical protein